MADGEIPSGSVFDRAAFESELLGLSDFLRTFALKLTQSVSDAEDLVQLTYCLALAGAERYDPTRKLRSWLGTVMHNAHVSVHRKSWRERTTHAGSSLEEELAAVHESAEEALDTKTAFLTAARHVLALPMRQRDAVVAQHYLGISHYGIVTIFSCSLGTAKGWIREGMRKVRSALAHNATAAPELDRIEESLQDFASDDPYFPIAQAVRELCARVKNA